ncbi:MAG TPA: ROK family transcriptional regulator [Bryobacteraceae bacterium]|nr:ROK family transcriptional regulator [Bryobacteraceae bacterium]
MLRRHSPLSRADLVRLSGLTAPTVSSGVAQLERQGLAIALGPGNSSGGRPPGLLEFHARHGYVIGADIGGSYMRLALADLNGTIAGKWNAALKADRSPQAVTEMMSAAISQLTKRHGVPMKKVLEVCAGAPGITDVLAGKVLSAPNLGGWRDVPWRELLQRELRIPVTIENDVNLGALGEGWKGAASGVSNFVFLAIGTGVGAGIVVNNMLYHGANWSAGEVGYMLLPNLSDDPPANNKPGALESAVGGKAIERAWTAMNGSRNGGEPLQATQIFDLSMAGDSMARSLLNRAAGQLAMAVTNLSLVLDLSLVVLGGGVGQHGALLQAMRRILQRNEFARPRLLASRLGGEAQIHGAIWTALQAAEASGFRRRSLTSGDSFAKSFVLAAKN